MGGEPGRRWAVPAARDPATAAAQSGQLPAPAPVQGVVVGRVCAPQRALRVVSLVGTACTRLSGAPRRPPPRPVRYSSLGSSGLPRGSANRPASARPAGRTGRCTADVRPGRAAEGDAGIRGLDGDAGDCWGSRVVAFRPLGWSAVRAGVGVLRAAAVGKAGTGWVRPGGGGSGAGKVRCSHDSWLDMPQKVRQMPASCAARAASCRASRPCRSQKSRAPSSTSTDGGSVLSASISWVRSCSAVCMSASPTTTRTCCSAARIGMTIRADGRSCQASPAGVPAEVTLVMRGCATAPPDAHTGWRRRRSRATARTVRHPLSAPVGDRQPASCAASQPAASAGPLGAVGPIARRPACSGAAGPGGPGALEQPLAGELPRDRRSGEVGQAQGVVAGVPPRDDERLVPP